MFRCELSDIHCEHDAEVIPVLFIRVLDHESSERVHETIAKRIGSASLAMPMIYY